MMDMDTPRANVGHMFPNVAAYVVDDNMNIVLRGGTGELVVEGSLVGRGYVGRPDLAQYISAMQLDGMRGLVFVCGPTSLSADCVKLTSEHGVAIHSETFEL